MRKSTVIEANDSEYQGVVIKSDPQRTVVSRTYLYSDSEPRRDGVEVTKFYLVTYSDGTTSEESESFWRYPEDDPEDW